MCPNNNSSNNASNIGENHASSSSNNRVETRVPIEAARDGDTLNATDDPPPILNRAAEIVPIRNQTPQHLATLVAPTNTTSCSSLADPLLVGNKYFVWGLADGKIAVWTNQQLSGSLSGVATTRTVIAPCTVLETNASTQWMQISCMSDEKEESPEMLCLTSAGVFFHVKLHHEKESSSSGVELEVTKTWHTTSPGAVCFCITKSHSIIVGYDNGNLEAWKKGKRLWFGNFKDYPRIRSIIPLETSTQKYVLLTLEPKDRLNTASNIEIVSLTAVEKCSDRDRTKAVQLEEYWVPLPENEREVADATALSETYRQRTGQRFTMHWVPSHGSHVATSLPLDCGLMMVEVADGSVLFLDAFMTNSNELCWGVAPGHNRGQFLLTYPSIGRGCIKIKEQWFAVCALRGGTVYLFPLSGNESTSAEHKEIRSCHYPDDISQDSSMHHLQAFIAGNLELPSLSDDISSFPLLFFCWPGGICDVYCSHLLPSRCADTGQLNALMENETVDNLYRFLQSLTNDPDNLLADALWNRARQEILECKAHKSSITSEDLRSSQLVHFRKLLRYLSDPSTADPT